MADAVAGVRWTAGRRRGGRRLHGWHDLLSDPGGQIARRGDVKLFLATEMIGDGGHRLAGRSCNGSGAGAIEAVPADRKSVVSGQSACVSVDLGSRRINKQKKNGSRKFKDMKRPTDHT